MNILDDLSFSQILNELRPSDIIKLGIVDRVHNVLTKDPLTKYRLLKRWCPTDKTVNELSKHVPNITLQQISVIANYYYPTNESINVYPADELFYNACKAGYSVEDCMKFLKFIYSPVIPIVTGRDDVLNLLVRQGRFPGFPEGKYNEGYISLLLHRDMTVKLWVDTIIKHGIDVEYLRILLDGNSSFSIERGVPHDYGTIKNSNHPEIARLANYFGLTISFNNTMYSGEDDMVILRYKLGIKNSNGSKTRAILSRYDSEKFPSYDIFDDICSGNYLEVMHKANTWDRDIPTPPGMKSYDDYYISYMGVNNNKLPPLCRKYINTRLETIGQCTKHNVK